MNKPLFRHIKKLLWQYKWKYITGAFFLLLTDIFQLISPKLIGWGVDYLNKGTLTFKSLLLVFIALLLLAILTAIFRFFWRMQILATARRLEAQIREKYFTHLQTLSLNFFNYKKTGELMALATNDLGAVREMFAFGIVMLLDTIFLGTLSIFFLLSISPKLTLYIAIPLPLITLTITFFGKITHRRFKLVQDSFAKLTDKAEETIAGIRVVKAYVQEEA